MAQDQEHMVLDHKSRLKSKSNLRALLWYTHGMGHISEILKAEKVVNINSQLD